MLGDRLVSLYGLNIGTNVVNELELSYVKVPGTILGYMDGLSIGTYDCKVPRYLEGSTEVIAEGKFEELLLGA